MNKYTEKINLCMREINRFIVGKENIIKLLLISILSGGHVLLEGYIGVAKTLLSKTFARVIGGTFRRIQCTSDLLPSDVLGTYVYSQKTGEYILKKGPIFSNIILLDEIDRASPRTQSAFIEAMQENQVSIEGVTLKLPQPFMIIATRVFIEEEGVFTLPKVQLDRFMMRIPVTIPLPKEEIEILNRIDLIDRFNVRRIFRLEDILWLKEEARRITVSPLIKKYIVEIINYLRKNRYVDFPVSPRGSIYLLKGARAKALLEGRDYVIPDDVKDIGFYVLNHRIGLKTEAEMEGITISSIINEAFKKIPVPR